MHRALIRRYSIARRKAVKFIKIYVCTSCEVWDVENSPVITETVGDCNEMLKDGKLFYSLMFRRTGCDWSICT